MFLARTALVIFVLLAGGSNAFAPMQRSAAPARVFRMSAEGEAKAEAPAPAPTAKPAADEKTIDDAIAKMASGDEEPTEAAPVNEEEETKVEEVTSEAVVEEEGSEASPEAEEEDVSIPEAATAPEAVVEEEKTEEAPQVTYYKRPTLTQDQLYIGKPRKKITDTPSPSPKKTEAVTSKVEEEPPQNRGEGTEYYKRPESKETKVEEAPKRGAGVTYYQRPTLTQKEIYSWNVKTPEEASAILAAKREREGKYVLKQNEEQAIFVKNLDRTKKKEKPKKKKTVRKTAAEKKAIRKANLKARAKKFVLKKNEEKATIVKKKMVAKATVMKKKIDAKPKVASKDKKKEEVGWGFGKKQKQVTKVKVTENKKEDDTPKKESTKPVTPKKESTTPVAKKEVEVKRKQASIDDIKRESAALLGNVEAAEKTAAKAATAVEKLEKSTKKKETAKGGFFGFFGGKKKESNASASEQTSIEDIKKETAKLLETSSSEK